MQKAWSLQQRLTDMERPSLWALDYHWSYKRLSKWQPPTPLLTMKYSAWWHFTFINTLRSGQNGHHSVDKISKFIFFMKIAAFALKFLWNLSKSHLNQHDQDVWRHTASPGHNELKSQLPWTTVCRCIWQSDIINLNNFNSSQFSRYETINFYGLSFDKLKHSLQEKHTNDLQLTSLSSLLFIKLSWRNSLGHKGQFIQIGHHVPFHISVVVVMLCVFFQ